MGDDSVCAVTLKLAAAMQTAAPAAAPHVLKRVVMQRS
jgi:hypothetical protein